jgi:hypothetical protein
MKTRVVKLSNSEYVPEFWVPNFLFGGHWVGISLDKEGSYFYYTGDSGILKYCVVSTEAEAEEIANTYLKIKQKKKMLL